MLDRRLKSLSHDSELHSALRELQEESIQLTLPGLYGVGIGMILLAGVFRPTVEGALPGLLLVEAR